MGRRRNAQRKGKGGGNPHAKNPHARNGKRGGGGGGKKRKRGKASASPQVSSVAERAARAAASSSSPGAGGAGGGGGGGAPAASPSPRPSEAKRARKSNGTRQVKAPPGVRLSALQVERRSLPIYSAREALVAQARRCRNLVIVGETGSGKTTQLPQYLHEAGFTKGGRMVACTQPRRVAAMTVARRVAEEMGTPLGHKVGYTIRFDDKTSPATRVKYMTDGMLLREACLDPLLSRYSVVILDEAHERTLHTDILFAVIKGIQRKRDDLVVIAMSATLEAEQFSEYFFNAKVLYVAGRQYPVQVMYTPEPEQDYLDAVLVTVLQIHVTKPAGDILVFLTGQDEIETTRALLEERMASTALTTNSEVLKMIVTPIYSALPSQEQLKVFQPTPDGCRKVVLATNIAETSVTINGIRYVVDTGVSKSRQYHSRTGMDCLKVTAISKAEAWQRAGRAGREAPGEAYRLYMEDTFLTLRESIVPEITRCNLSSVVLQLKALGVKDVLRFDFMDRPPHAALVRAMEQLYALDALDGEGNLSVPLGQQMAAFPLDPLFSRALLASAGSEELVPCSEEMLSIVSMLSVESIFVTPSRKRDQANAAKRRFTSFEGDQLTLLNVYRAWIENKKSRTWCKKNFINARSMDKVADVRAQLVDLFRQNKVPVLSCGPELEHVRRALVKGFFLNAAQRQPDGTYRSFIDGQIVGIHPSSVLLNQRAPCIIYNEMVLTSKQYVRDVTRIEPAWLAELAPKFYSNAGGSASNRYHLSQRKLEQLSRAGE